MPDAITQRALKPVVVTVLSITIDTCIGFDAGDTPGSCDMRSAIEIFLVTAGSCTGNVTVASPSTIVTAEPKTSTAPSDQIIQAPLAFVPRLITYFDSPKPTFLKMHNY